MAYERHNWVCEDNISADRLNNIEDGIEEALDCCGGGGGETSIPTVTLEATSDNSWWVRFNNFLGYSMDSGLTIDTDTETGDLYVRYDEISSLPEDNVPEYVKQLATLWLEYFIASAGVNSAAINILYAILEEQLTDGFPITLPIAF